MNRQEFEDTARRYREELFRMYASQNIDPQPKPAAKPAEPAAVPVQRTIPADLPQQQPAMPAPETNLPPAETVSAQEPESETVPQAPEPESAAETGSDDRKRAYTGIIRVHVSTARGARPVSGATVIITHVTTGEPELVSLQTTDQSGNIAAVTVPAPPPSDDQRHPQSFLYDITAQASGYYREHSTDVPVFPNVTSMQDFDLIPLPAGADEPVPDGDITFYNNMQQF